MSVRVLKDGKVTWLSTYWGKHALDELRRQGYIIVFCEVHE